MSDRGKIGEGSAGILTALLKRSRGIVGPLALGLAAAACASGADYLRPSVATPQAFRQEPPAGWKEAQASDRLPRGPWWTLFEDETLDALAQQAVRANYSVQASEAAVRQVRAQLRQTAAARYPFVSGALGASRTTGSASGFSGGGDFGSTASNESYRAGVDATWEVDLWGRIRRSVEAGEAQLQSAAADLETARLAVVAELASVYFSLRIVDAQRQLLTDTVAAYQRSLQLTRNRYQAGVVPRADVVQAEVQLKTTQAQLVDTGIQRVALESAIAVLVGRPPGDFQVVAAAAGNDRQQVDRLPTDRSPPTDASRRAMVKEIAEYPGIPRVPVVPAGLPSDLLERRPDVAAAERAVAASNARIGVAQAAYFPTLSLSASAGLRESSFSDLLGSPAWFWSPALSLVQALFDAGARKAVTAQAIAAYEGQVASYRQTVLLSFKEVEDSLAAVRLLDEEIALQVEALMAARLALQLVTNQYQSGVINYLNVLTAQTSALNSERSLLDLRGRRLAASVALIKALGGGWQGIDLHAGN